MDEQQDRSGESDPAPAGRIAAWRAEIDAMVERMQTQSFAAAVRKVLDEPLRVSVFERWTREANRNRTQAETEAPPQKKSQP